METFCDFIRDIVFLSYRHFADILTASIHLQEVTRAEFYNALVE